jgi:hypothetical protein
MLMLRLLLLLLLRLLLLLTASLLAVFSVLPPLQLPPVLHVVVLVVPVKENASKRTGQSAYPHRSTPDHLHQSKQMHRNYQRRSDELQWQIVALHSNRGGRSGSA